MNSLKEVWQSLVEHEKTAGDATPPQPSLPEDEQTKLAMQQALDYDQVGRELARHVYRDMLKEATEHLPVGHGPGHKHEDGTPCAPECQHHGKGAARVEKKASLERQILERMQRDPAYVSELVAKHYGG